MLATLVLLVLLFIRRAWAARVLQLALLLAAAEWMLTAIQVVQVRMARGDDYLRAAIILLAVAAVNLLAAFLFRSSRLATRYRLISATADREEQGVRTSAPAASADYLPPAATR